jgi:hypothetical protein
MSFPSHPMLLPFVMQREEQLRSFCYNPSALGTATGEVNCALCQCEDYSSGYLEVSGLPHACGSRDV